MMTGKRDMEIRYRSGATRPSLSAISSGERGDSSLQPSAIHYSLFAIHCSLFAVLCFLFASCIREDDYDNSPRGNFEALWTIIDEHYCYLDYKGIDWDSIYSVYSPLISDDMTSTALFEVLGNMLCELKDGHVNLSSSQNVARYWDWYLDYPDNFDLDLVEDYYLGRDYRIAGGIKYTILEDNVGYALYESFSDGIGNGNIDYVLSYFALCNGMIFDVRDNSGGYLTYADLLAARFTNEKTLIGYIQYKTGTGHSDFSDPEALYIEPSTSIRWQKPVIVLTNRQAYSATNYFVNAMTVMPQATIVGDRTGGGGGLPFTSELPNGWSVRFSASPLLNVNLEHTEDGIEPDYYVDMDEDDEDNGIDTIIEFARALIDGSDTDGDEE